MGSLVSLFFLLAIVGVSDAAWCVCKSDASPIAQQKTIDYACGEGADCGPISQSGACYNPNTVPAHCSYAANSYYQRKGQAQGACDFSGSATLTTTDPSGSGCTYPATPSAAGTSTPTPGGTTTPTSPGSTPTPATPTSPGSITTPTSPGSTTTPTTNPGTTTPSTFPGTTTPNTFTPTTGSGGGFGGLGPSGNGITDTSAASSLSKEKMSLVLAVLISYMVLVRG